jgi:signal transduction histidine kinase
MRCGTVQSSEAERVVGSIVHEISQPLTAVIVNTLATIRYLSTNPPNLPAAQASLHLLLQDSRDASETITSTRALFHHIDVPKGLLNLGAVIDKAIDLMEAELRRSKITLKLNLNGKLPLVFGNELQLRQVLVNLIRNAIDSMEHNSGWPKEIEIRAYRAGKRVLIEVADRGNGVFDAAKTFKPFFTTKSSGMGMGLAICKMIVDAHKGKLWAKSRQPRGTLFGFAMPVEGVGGHGMQRQRVSA